MSSVLVQHSAVGKGSLQVCPCMSNKSGSAAFVSEDGKVLKEHLAS